ncbi:MAG TPA: hypothetical protein VE954_40020 [Oligoflexus sp.]|uniref:hypothetical protein n=1 Tax=Oligoflexus sp. TaxID=1971216 RepID=UPI002D725A2F|nr:hypothetical protein [Oligoflexus sp.]HYX39330.1 hypothetical protein [Oligoflexus sp.]
MVVRLSFLLGILWNLACSPTGARRFEGVARICGDETLVSDREASVLQVKQPNGETLDALMLDQVSVRFRPQQGPMQPLPMTRKACVRVPPENGQVEVQLGRHTWAAVKKFDHSVRAPRFDELRLSPVGEFKVKLTCPVDGYFVNQTLSMPVGIQIQGSGDLMGFALRVRNSGDQSRTTLWQKPVGSRLNELPTAVSTSELAQGVYKLELIAWDLSRNWEDATGYQESCDLIVLKTVPTVTGLPLASNLRIPVYEPDAIIPFESNDTQAQLFSCKEAVDTYAPDQPCPPSSLCAGDASFSATNLVRIKEPGLWRVRAYFQDRAGNRSAMSCRTVAISAKAPGLTVRWDDEALNRPDAVLALPKPYLAANIQLEHPQLAAETLESHLLCKVDFLVGGVSVRSGKDVMCVNGSCAGQSLDTFRTCDRSLKMTLAAALQESAVSDAQLRLTVRSQDGAGHVDEKVLPLWLQKNPWGYTALATPLQKPEEMSINAAGEVIIREEGKTFLRRSQGWIELNPPVTDPIASVHVFSAPEHRTLALWEIKTPTANAPDQRQSFFAELKDQSWQRLDVEGWNPAVDRCDQIFSARSHTILCSNSKELIQLNGSRVEAREAVDAGTTCLQNSDVGNIVRYGRTSWAVACRTGELWVTRDRGGWELLDENNPLGAVKPLSLKADSEGRLWYIKGFSVGYKFYMFVWDQSENNLVQAPDPIEPNFPALTLALNSRGQLLFERYIWDEDKKAWLERPQLRELFPTGVLRALNAPDGGVLYESVEQIVYENPVDMDWHLIPWKGLNAVPRTSTLTLVQGPESGLCLLADATPALHCQEPSNWSFWGKRYLNLPNEKIVSVQADTKGFLTAQVEGRGAFQLRDGGWNRFLPEANFRVTSVFPAQDNYYLGSPEGVWSYDAAARRWINVFSFIETAFEYSSWLAHDHAFARDAKGREWFVQSTGGFLVREAGLWKREHWFDPDILVDKIAVVNGSFVAMSGLPPFAWPRITTFDEASQSFSVRNLSEWSIDPENLTAYDLSREGMLVMRETSGHLVMIDLRSGKLRRGPAPHDGLIFKAFVHKERLVLVMESGVYEESEPGVWKVVLDRSVIKPEIEWQPQQAFLDAYGHLWIPVTLAPSSWFHDLLRVDLRE